MEPESRSYHLGVQDHTQDSPADTLPQLTPTQQSALQWVRLSHLSMALLLSQEALAQQQQQMLGAL
jgi:hypothetical protein